MRAGEAWWSGREELLSTILDKQRPAQLDASAVIRASIRKSPGFKEGVGHHAGTLQKARPQFVHGILWKESAMIELASVESTDRANEALTKLEAHLATFKSKVGNDLTSMKAASQRVQTEVQSMSEKYAAARDLLTSPEFERAIVNAERMALALKSISELSDTKLSVAVFGGGKVPAA